MRVRVAVDRAVRSLTKTLIPPAPRHRRTLSHAADAAPRTRYKDELILKHWSRRTGHPNSVFAVLACNDPVLLNTSLASLPNNVRTSIAYPVSLPVDTHSITLTSPIDGIWSHTAALNLAAARAPASTLLLLPCGCVSPRVLKHTNKEYYTPQVDDASPADEGNVCAHTILVSKKDLFAVRAADERVAALADPSLRARLAHNGLTSRASLPIPTHTTPFEPHAAVQLATDAQLQLAAASWDTIPPSTPENNADAYESSIARRKALVAILARRAATYTMTATGVFRPSSAAAPLTRLLRAEEGAVDAAHALATRRVIRARYAVPLALTVGMRPAEVRRLLVALAADENKRADRENVRIVVVQPAHGLGNRLRAVGSARAYARATNRHLLVVWERDAHCEARWDALFAPMSDVFVTEVAPTWPSAAPDTRSDVAWHAWRVFDYMSPDGKDVPVDARQDEHVLFRSAYVLHAAQPRAATWAAANTEMRALVPNAVVTELVAANAPQAAGAVGVHVRARALAGEVQGASYSANGTALLSYWRAKSDPSAFVAEMARMRTAEPHTHFIVAADCDKARNALRTVPDTVILPGCDGRGEKCVQHAFAELLILARTRFLLASPWSSFSEVVVRLGGISSRVAGVDFAVDEPDDVAATHGKHVAAVVAEVQRRRAAKMAKKHGI